MDPGVKSCDRMNKIQEKKKNAEMNIIQMDIKSKATKANNQTQTQRKQQD